MMQVKAFVRLNKGIFGALLVHYSVKTETTLRRFKEQRKYNSCNSKISFIKTNVNIYTIIHIKKMSIRRDTWVCTEIIFFL